MLLSKAGVLPLGRAPSAGVFSLRVLPSVVSFAGTLYLGNLAYLSLSMAFIQMLKAMVPAITLVSRDCKIPKLSAALPHTAARGADKRSDGACCRCCA